MAIDLAQVETLERAVRAAEQRLATVPPQLRGAAELALARARAALADLWSAHLAEQVAAADALLTAARSTDVLALLPVGLEAKLQPAQHRLRLRVWPETIARATHDPALTARERDAGRQYWVTSGRSGVDDESAWQTLAGLLGPRRAAWVAQVLTPVNAADLAGGAAPVFPDVTLADPADPFVPAALVPDRWIVLGFRTGKQVLAHVGPPITRPLVAGLDTSADALAAADAGDGPITLPPRMRWMSDFAAAADAGMAMDILVPADRDQLDQLFVVGIRGGGAIGTQELQDLLTGHRFGRGLAFVPQGTPSNNSPSGSSGLPTRDDAASHAFALERRPRNYGAPGSNGERFAAALGISLAKVANAACSGAVPEIGQEPGGFEPGIARAMRTLLWMPVLGHLLEDLIGADPARVAVVREHFIESVVAAGPIPAIRVGDQPYGILPVTSLSGFASMPGEPIDPMVLSVLRTIPQISQTMHLDTDRAEDLLNFTARPRTFLEAVMTPGTPFFSEFTGNADWLHEHSNGTIPTAWARGALKNLTGDWAYPPGFSLENMDQLPARTLADEATPAALAALAVIRPHALRASAPTGSTLTRIARYTTLLEWARFAQAVGEAALSGTSFLDGARAAGASNRAVWLDLLDHAFDASLPAPVPVAPDTAARIRDLTGSLDQPAACPGQARLAAFRAALDVLAQAPPSQLASIAYPVLDLTHAREDAWQTSLATRRLTTLRTTGTAGSVVGGFGWLLDVRAETLLPPFTAEYIHAPSHDHAAAAAVLRSAAVRAGDAGSSHADIDLSSRRVRLARWLTAGVSSGRPLLELLGARFERRLAEAGGGGLLPRLRRDFPSALSSGILDGLALHANPPAITDAAFTAALAELNDGFDALADAVTAEGVYHIVRGHPTRALIDVDDVVRGDVAPTLEITRSPSPATTVTHRVAAVVPVGGVAPGWAAVHSPRAQADPLLDAWCGHLVGPANATVLTVDATGSDGSPLEIPCGLDALGIGALDVLTATRDNGSELTERLLAAARSSRPGLTGAAVRSDTAWKDLLRLGSRVERLLARAQPLTGDALTLPGAPAGEGSGDDAGDLPARVTQARTRLEAVRDTLSSATAPTSVIGEAAGFGIVLPGMAFDIPPTPDDRAALTSAVQGRLTAAAGRTTARDQLRALVDGVLGLVAVHAADPAVLTTAAALPGSAPGTTVTTDPARCAGWLEAMGRVRPALTPLTDVMALAEMSGRAAAPPLRIAQAPWSPGDPWIALGWTNAQTRAPATGRLSLVLHAPAGLEPAGPLGGFLIDAWADAVPAAVRDTALAVRHNGPNTRAPQTVVLAVAPDMSVPAWTAATLTACLRETLDAVVLRQGILFLYRPLVFLGHRTDDAGISYDGGESVT